MAEAKWLVEPEPAAMLGHLLAALGAQGRGFRVFACAALRGAGRPLTDPRCRKALETAERYAWGLTDKKDLQRAARAMEDVVRRSWNGLLREDESAEAD